jgi:hypothetical protein
LEDAKENVKRGSVMVGPAYFYDAIFKGIDIVRAFDCEIVDLVVSFVALVEKSSYVGYVIAVYGLDRKIFCRKAHCFFGINQINKSITNHFVGNVS